MNVEFIIFFFCVFVLVWIFEGNVKEKNFVRYEWCIYMFFYEIRVWVFVGFGEGVVDVGEGFSLEGFVVVVYF